MKNWLINTNQLDAPIQRAAVTIGMFDGVHQGHRALIETLSRISNGDPKVAITFDNHPLSVISPDRSPKLLTTAAEKEALLKQYGIDHILMLRADPRLFSMSADEFIKTFLCGIIETRHLVIGSDFALGKARAGDSIYLSHASREYQFSLTVVPPVKTRGAVVSSTRIRGLISEGKVEEATECLGRPYSISGNVITGKQLGRTLRYPTANLQVPSYKVIPADGIYAGVVQVGDQFYRSAISIGIRPTVSGIGRTIEAYLLDFEGDLYGASLSYHFIRRLRDEQKFTSLDALKEQIAHDVEETRRVNPPLG